jgi:hypothetical protein
MQKRRHKVWLLMGVTMITLMFTFAACEPSGTTLEEAITIATQAVVNDGVMSLDGRDTESADEVTYWHIYFPYTSHELLGGEPHVWVDKTTGDVTNIYYTQ